MALHSSVHIIIHLHSIFFLLQFCRETT